MKKQVNEDTRALNRIAQSIYRATQEYTGKVYRDDNWAAVGGLCDIVRGVPGVTDVSLGHGNYENYLNPEQGARKTYIMEISTEFGELYGRVTCSAAGTVEDPFSMYDITMTVGRYRPNELDESRKIVHESVVKAFKDHGLL